MCSLLKQKNIFLCYLKDKVEQLKEEVRVQYQKMQQLLEEDLGKTLEVLEKARVKFCQENSSQVLQLNEQHQEAKKLLSSVQVLFDKADDINFMKVWYLSLIPIFFINLSINKSLHAHNQSLE